MISGLLNVGKAAAPKLAAGGLYGLGAVMTGVQLADTDSYEEV